MHPRSRNNEAYLNWWVPQQVEVHKKPHPSEDVKVFGNVPVPKKPAPAPTCYGLWKKGNKKQKSLVLRQQPNIVNISIPASVESLIASIVIPETKLREERESDELLDVQRTREAIKAAERRKNKLIASFRSLRKEFKDIDQEGSSHADPEMYKKLLDISQELELHWNPLKKNVALNEQDNQISRDPKDLIGHDGKPYKWHSDTGDYILNRYYQEIPYHQNYGFYRQYGSKGRGATTSAGHPKRIPKRVHVYSCGST